jgi:RHS repeat-associated protein
VRPAAIRKSSDENQSTVSNAWRSEFAYDGFGRRRIVRDYSWDVGSLAWNKTNEVRYLYDGRLVIEEQTTNGAPLVFYTRGNDLSGSLQGAGGIGGLLARTDGINKVLAGNWLLNDASALPPISYRGGTHSYYHSDANGNVTALVTQMKPGIQSFLTQYSYDPYGNLLWMNGPMAQTNLYRFSSKEFHPNSGLIYYLYRYYEPNLQRWINRDPHQEDGGANLFTFIFNAVMQAFDPFGFCGGGDPSDLFNQGTPHPIDLAPWMTWLPKHPQDHPDSKNPLQDLGQQLGKQLADWLKPLALDALSHASTGEKLGVVGVAAAAAAGYAAQTVLNHQKLDLPGVSLPLGKNTSLNLEGWLQNVDNGANKGLQGGIKCSVTRSFP